MSDSSKRPKANKAARHRLADASHSNVARGQRTGRTRLDLALHEHPVLEVRYQLFSSSS
jgi:hypothetical protein